MNQIGKTVSCLALAAGFEVANDQITSLLQLRTKHHEGASLQHQADGWTTVVALSGTGNKKSVDVGEGNFNELFQSCPVVRYWRNGAVHSVYVRSSAVAINAYQVFTDTFTSDNNQLGSDFQIYSSLADAQGQSNAWSSCNYDDPDVGYPRDCGIKGLVTDQWFTMPGDEFDIRGITNGAKFEIYTGDDCPTPKSGVGEFIGCFVDDGDRDLGDDMVGGRDDASSNTFDLCRAACGSNIYMSLQFGGECFCANTYGNGDQYAQKDESECNGEDGKAIEPCASNSYNCGGRLRNAVYQINPKPGAAEFIGCFVDDASRDLGAMVGQNSNDATNTFELCRAKCGTQRYMSMQFGGECFCSDSYGNGDQYAKVDKSECDGKSGTALEPCNKNSYNCGGTWRNAIYEINKPGAAEFIGCYQDDGQRDLGVMVGTASNAATNTFELCRATCGDKIYMSLQYGGECFCSNSFANGDQYVKLDESKCNGQGGTAIEPCFSNSYNCGGTLANAVYKIN